MLPRALIGDIKPENWLGLIDAIYAIILTLLLIDLPHSLLDLVNLNKNVPHLHFVFWQSVVLDILGYFAIFLIIYDVWSHHRVLLVHSLATRFNFAFGVFLLFLSSLIPPLHSVLSRLKYQFLIGELRPSGIPYQIYSDARHVLFFILVGIYGSIALVSAMDLLTLRKLEGSGFRSIVLERLKASSLVMLPIIILMGILTFYNLLYPPIPLVLMALGTFLPLDRLIIKLQRRLLPRRVKQQQSVAQPNR